jgi:predicted alpha/beta hydrolase
VTAVEQARTTRTEERGNTSVLPWTSEEPAALRFPAPDDPAPSERRMVGMSLCGAALGLTGVGVGLYAVVAVFGGAPGWYLPVLGLLTLLSVGPAAAAFLAVHQRRLPWLLMMAAAPPMVGAAMVALAY